MTLLPADLDPSPDAREPDLLIRGLVFGLPLMLLTWAPIIGLAWLWWVA